MSVSLKKLGSGLYSTKVLNAFDDNPLEKWDKQIRNGSIRRISNNKTNPDTLRCLELTTPSRFSNATYITTPISYMDSLAIKLPVLLIVAKNLGKPFSFEVQILDDHNFKRRFIVSTSEKLIRVKDYVAYLPLSLEEGWNQIFLSLDHFNRRIFRTKFVEVVRILIHPNIILREVRFCPEEYKIIVKNDNDEVDEESNANVPIRKKSDFQSQANCVAAVAVASAAKEFAVVAGVGSEKSDNFKNLQKRQNENKPAPPPEKTRIEPRSSSEQNQKNFTLLCNNRKLDTNLDSLEEEAQRLKKQYQERSKLIQDTKSAIKKIKTANNSLPLNRNINQVQNQNLGQVQIQNQNLGQGQNQNRGQGQSQNQNHSLVQSQIKNPNQGQNINQNQNVIKKQGGQTGQSQESRQNEKMNLLPASKIELTEENKEILRPKIKSILKKVKVENEKIVHEIKLEEFIPKMRPASASETLTPSAKYLLEDTQRPVTDSVHIQLNHKNKESPIQKAAISSTPATAAPVAPKTESASIPSATTTSTQRRKRKRNRNQAQSHPVQLHLKLQSQSQDENKNENCDQKCENGICSCKCGTSKSHHHHHKSVKTGSSKSPKSVSNIKKSGGGRKRVARSQKSKIKIEKSAKTQN